MSDQHGSHGNDVVFDNRHRLRNMILKHCRAHALPLSGLHWLVGRTLMITPWEMWRMWVSFLIALCLSLHSPLWISTHPAGRSSWQTLYKSCLFARWTETKQTLNSTQDEVKQITSPLCRVLSHKFQPGYVIEFVWMMYFLALIRYWCQILILIQVSGLGMVTIWPILGSSIFHEVTCL